MKKKKVLALILSVVMVATLIPASAFAKMHYRHPNGEGNKYGKYYSWDAVPQNNLPNVYKPTAKDVPDNLLVTAIENNKLQLSWDAVDGADSYALYQKVSGKSFKKVKTTSATSFTTSSKKSNVTYYYRVKAIKNGKYSNYSYWVSAQPSGSKLKNCTSFVRRISSYDKNRFYLANSDNTLFVSSINANMYSPAALSSMAGLCEPIYIKLAQSSNRVSSKVRVINYDPSVLKLGLPIKPEEGEWSYANNPGENYRRLYEGLSIVGVKNNKLTGNKYGDVVILDLITHTGSKAKVMYILADYKKSVDSTLMDNAKKYGGITDISKYEDGSYITNPDYIVIDYGF
ncbi:MAG: fibronectin type III domain-containing protein [Anaerovoracaceae bacterium]